jgi:ABC-type sugar transport system substrate-binding protein
MNRGIQFIGREREISKIQDSFSEWMTCRNIYVEGDGGIGKTRLMQEVYKLAVYYKTPVEKKRLTIGIVQEFTHSEWSKEFIKGVREEAGNFDVDLIETDANYDTSKMVSDLESVIAKKPEVLLISLGSDPLLSSGIKQAIHQGIKVLTFDNSLQGISGIKSRVDQDDDEGARLLAKDIADHVNYEGKIAAIFTIGHAIQDKRHEVLQSYIEKYPDIHLIDSFCALSDAESKAYNLVKDLLVSHPDIKSIWTAFNEFARGIVRALVDINRTDIGVFSFDFCPSDYKLMKTPNSPWVSTVAISPSEGGKILIRLAVTASYGKDIKKHYPLSMELIKQSEVVSDKDFLVNWYRQEIGWSNWLRSLYAGLHAKQKSHLQVVEIFDFDNDMLHVDENLELQLLQNLVDSRSDSYENILFLLRELREIEIGGGVESLSAQRNKILKYLVDAINERAGDRRVVLFFDTVEKIDPEVSERLLSITTQLENAVCIFSGRPNQGIFWKKLNSHSKHSAQKIALKRFSQEESNRYILDKQKKAHIFLPTELIKRLIVLSHGHPILIDLAVEFVTRSISLDSVLKIDIDHLNQSSIAKQTKIRQSFESNLVQHILQIRRPMDKLILILSRIYPLTKNMLGDMMGLSESESAKLYDEATGYVFIKVLPGGLGISLHDEMRELVKKHVWAKIDRWDERQRRDSRLAVNLYMKLDLDLREKKKQLEKMRENQKFDIKTIFEIEKIKRERELATEKWVEHMFYSEYDQAFSRWENLITKVRIGKKYTFISRLVDLAKIYFSTFNEKERYLFNFYYARSLSDTGELNSALKILLRLLSVENGNNKAGILNLLGVIYKRKGEYLAAKKYQKECLELVDKTNLQARANILNQIGVISRHLGDNSEAKQCYGQAQELAVLRHKQLKSDDDRKVNQALLASLSNNLAYVYGLQREFSTAESLCNDALKMWLQSGKKADAARAETTLAILLRDQGHYRQAYNLLMSAINRLTEPEYPEELCRAYFHLAWVEWYQAEMQTENEKDISDISWNSEKLATALDVFMKSRMVAEKYGLKAELPGILHQTASVIWHLGRTTSNQKLELQARKLNVKAIEISEEIHDTRYAIDAILGDAEWDYEIGKYSNIENYSVRLFKQYGNSKDRYKLYFGRMARIEADISLKKRDYKKAFAKYSEAFLLINTHKGFGRYSIVRELSRFSQKLENLNPELTAKWVTFLQEQWQNKSENQLLLSWCTQTLLHNRVRFVGR